MTNLEDLSTQNSKKFNILSGRLLVSDPYYLGYGEDVHEKLDALKRTITYLKNPLVVFPNGIFWYLQDDCSLSVYKENDQIRIYQESDVNEEIRKSMDEPNISTNVEVASVIIGDYERFSVPEGEIQVRCPEFLQGEDARSHVESIKKDALRANKKNSLTVNNGSYSVEYSPQEESVLIKLVE